ncbi:P-loop containing nucleoside triphosphate hydrolase protein [Protomyces lactucae-debilis]|uniref:p-loop containing nucleoside triphosphate hydrolase protein n=1 Tax=Protomyces lactucae-debilis TaxID=2754530 RepID=A0A1Y2FK48_PROLT|nr:P-loop containing nucleoside triphosphate hydrolase protein [Protomyces lactucae-debilis]ORY84351.1 P-loop containing nucleoside triphosphate hydrolase protein [Protomyces lactucae-debilis]
MLYLKHLESLCDLELEAQYARFATYNRYDTALLPLERADAPSGLYVCEVPGVQEFTPPAMPGDLVQLRQLIPERQMADGYIYTARVYACERRKGKVILQIPDIWYHSGRFNLEFFYNSKTMFNIKHELAAAALDASTWMHSHLNPKPHHGRIQTELTRLLPFKWYDKSLNLEQQKAVQDVVHRPYGDEIPWCLHGPAGTGKTKTVCEAILQVLLDKPDAHVLACGPSNTAADTIAMRLIAHIRNPADLLVLNLDNRTFAEVPEPLLPFCHVTDGSFTMPTFQQLMRYRVIVGTCTAICELTQNRCRNLDLAKFEAQAMQKVQWLHPAMQHTIKPHFTHLFIDEAGQAGEPETIAVLRVVEYPGVSVVLAADHKQLGPQLESSVARQKGLDVSLFERLMDRSVYCDHPYARRNLMKNPRPALPFAYPPFCNLYRNYRSHPAILMVPSFLSYDSSLAACATDVDGVATRLGRIPVEFIAHEGKEEMTDLNVVHSWYNTAEIKLIKERILKLQEWVQPKDIAVIAPFREQVVKIRFALRAVQLAAVGVGTVEDYQGAEAQVVIVCLVRAQERFLDGDLTANLGLINQKRRMNVALTRAKQLCVVIGNASLLASDPHWQVFLKFCKRHGVCSGTPLPASLQVDSIEALSTMERAYLLRHDDERVLGGSTITHEQNGYPAIAELIVGGTAQMVLDGE